MQCDGRPELTLSEPQSQFGDKPLKFQILCPQNGFAVLKGSYGIVQNLYIQEFLQTIFIPIINHCPQQYLFFPARGSWLSRNLLAL